MGEQNDYYTIDKMRGSPFLMHIHIMGIAGTFMAGLARLAKQLGHEVTGSDKGEIYPPMSTQLQDDGITVFAGFSEKNLHPRPDWVVVGNAISRGNPEMEALLNSTIPFTSGPEWLYETVLRDRHVLAVSGTHGKTTTSAMLTCALLDNGVDCGYLIGGVPKNLPGSANLGTAPYFVIEADEYDSAFFDKRSKFLHYHPRTLILNNLEFDHADIFADLAAIQTQFAYLLRTVPSTGLIIVEADEPNLQAVLDKGCWTPTQSFGLDQGDWTARLLSPDAASFEIFFEGKSQGTISWGLTGVHNASNALACIAAATQAGVSPVQSIQSLSKFVAPKRRMEIIAEHKGITVYDDFAHHPTAFAKTLQGLRAKVGKSKIIVCLEMRSYTMRSGYHGDNVMKGLSDADEVILLRPEHLNEDQSQALAKAHRHCILVPNIDTLLHTALKDAAQGDQIVIMSNGGFDGLREKLVTALESA
jgi:UDP-N-acetylmuramate: L-alanyl-gamma-D-glutamyl-meso-diaminopimelate ligase